ncbi:phage terminase small subunit [Sporolactobacillus terrae]|uniref:phage terminase small subunit n=1 Tax=Sporolactobacillus terrae TaxID=269673 RepID=UPI00048D0709|nr:phage terminase small subunit [Sporolactobacillus terrae]
MDDNKDKAYRDYQNGMKYKDIAEKYGVSLNTVKSWKKRYKWIREKGAHKKERVHTKGAPIGNQNAKGHGAPPANQNATKFGFFSKYLPAESVEIMQEINTAEPADLLWDQIMIQYTAIIRAQKIMFVENKDELTKELKKGKVDYFPELGSKPVPVEAEYELQFAWDKQANFLNAQSRAMGELRSLIKQFLAIANEEDERKKKLELMQANIDKINHDMSKDNQNDGPIEITITREGDH